MSTNIVRSAKEHVKELRAAPSHWMDTAIVVVFHDRFEFVREDCPEPSALLGALEAHGGLAIGLAGIQPSASSQGIFSVKVFREYEGQAWTHRHMERLRKIVMDGRSI